MSIRLSTLLAASLLLSSLLPGCSHPPAAAPGPATTAAPTPAAGLTKTVAPPASSPVATQPATAALGGPANATSPGDQGQSYPTAAMGTRGAGSPAQVDGAHADALTISWRPFGPEWDSDLVKYPAPTSYLTGGNGYVTHFEGPNDGRVPKNIEAYTYRSISGGIPVASYAIAVWGYRVSWFQVITGNPTKYRYLGSINVPALWVRTRTSQPDGSASEIYREVKEGRYQVTIPPAGSRLLPDTPFKIAVEPAKIVLHAPLEYEDDSTLTPPFSPVIPSDTSFTPLSIFYASGPDWYYGLSSLAFYDNLLDFFPRARDSAAAGLPPDTLDPFHYTGSDKPTGSIFTDNPWRSQVFWWFGQPSAAGNGRGGSVWFPVCGPKGYTAGDTQYKWGSFGFIGPRQMVVLDARTAPEPFEMVRSDPVNGQKAVPLDARIQIEFSKPLGRVVQNRIVLMESSGQTLPFSWQISNQLLSIRPSQRLKTNTDYRLVVYKDAVTSGAGEKLASDLTIAFSTKPESGGGPGGPYKPQ